VLTADLVNARRRGDELRLVKLDDAGRERACAIAEAILATAATYVGRTREELALAIGSIDVGPREHRVKDGLEKLVFDRCTFDVPEGVDAEALRREVFLRSSEARAALEPGTRLDRLAVLAEIASASGTTPEAIDRALFSDLRGAHVLEAFESTEAATLVAMYERAQAQAVLLRAVKVTAHVRCASPGALRAFFRQLKFLRLLHVITKTDEGYCVVIDGPFSLFESVTKYGLQLALILPALESCDAWRLEADVRWGKERKPLAFKLEGALSASASAPPMPDAVDALVKSFDALASTWKVAPNDAILDLPGVGLSIPDLVFEKKGRGKKKPRVYLEVMGYWSRAAVWQRVELVQAGLGERILFAVSSRLRVSEEVLDDALPGALYVYKGTMSARTILERLDKLVPA
jgi:predicted nuclease of restriction endonuclease-like RecB superfamily